MGMKKFTHLPDHIVIHHSASKDTSRLDKAFIEGLHERKGWADIGYHAVVELIDGRYHVVQGRPIRYQGAHAYGFNHRSLGVCFLGNYDTDSPDRGMLEYAVENWIGPMCWALNISPDRVKAHNEVGRTATVCPGRLFPMPLLRSLVETNWKSK